MRVAALVGGESHQQRLIDLGLHVGVRLEIVQQRPNGLLVAVNDDVHIVVDPATAQAVLVVRLEPTLPSMTIAGTRPQANGHGSSASCRPAGGRGCLRRGWRCRRSAGSPRPRLPPRAAARPISSGPKRAAKSGSCASVRHWSRKITTAWLSMAASHCIDNGLVDRSAEINPNDLRDERRRKRSRFPWPCCLPATARYTFAPAGATMVQRTRMKSSPRDRRVWIRATVRSLPRQPGTGRLERRRDETSTSALPARLTQSVQHVFVIIGTVPGRALPSITLECIGRLCQCVTQCRARFLRSAELTQRRCEPSYTSALKG